MREAYRARRDLALERLTEEGLPCSRPDGAFYALVDVRTEDATAFARSLASRDGGVACAPGDAFGSGAAGMFRLSLAASPEAIDEGIRRIGRAVREER